MIMKKHIIALAAAALAVPSAASANEANGPAVYVGQQGVAGVLVALLLPAVQKVREAARR